jgi:hypothetical protein
MDTKMQHGSEHDDDDDNKSGNYQNNDTNDESHEGGIGDRDIETPETSITELELNYQVEVSVWSNVANVGSRP